MTVKPTGFVSILCILLITGCTPSEEIDNASPWFSEVAVASGIDFVHHSGYDGRPMMPEMMGGGVALADIDRDNDLDLYLVQSGRVDRSLPAEQSANVLYLNRGNGHFEKVPDAAGAGDRGYGMGVAAADYDNDGDADLYVSNYGRNTLYRNEGDARFVDATEAA